MIAPEPLNFPDPLAQRRFVSQRLFLVLASPAKNVSLPSMR